MGFDEFLGNERIVRALRGMLQRERVPSALLFTGPRGIGKYTLARMFAQAANCQHLRDDFCGECDSCLRMAPLADPAPLVQAGLGERGESADASAVERTPLILETHPDVWVIAPDPVRLRTPVARPVIRVGQLRAVQRAAYFKPQGRRRVFILDGADTMRWTDADVFLKILEEPPESATLILLAQNPGSLLQTIRSRCLQFHFAPVPTEQIEAFLKERTDAEAGRTQTGRPAFRRQPRRGPFTRPRGIGAPSEKRFAPSRPVGFRRKLCRPLRNPPLSSAKQEQESFENILGLFYSLLTDLLEFSYGIDGQSPSQSRSAAGKSKALARRSTGRGLLRATRGLDALESRLAPQYRAPTGPGCADCLTSVG